MFQCLAFDVARNQFNPWLDQRYLLRSNMGKTGSCLMKRGGTMFYYYKYEFHNTC